LQLQHVGLTSFVF